MRHGSGRCQDCLQRNGLLHMHMCAVLSVACRCVHTHAPAKRAELLRLARVLLLAPCCSDLERRQLHDKEKLRREQAAKIRETKLAMAQLAGEEGDLFMSQQRPGTATPGPCGIT